MLLDHCNPPLSLCMLSTGGGPPGTGEGLERLWEAGGDMSS